MKDVFTGQIGMKKNVQYVRLCTSTASTMLLQCGQKMSVAGLAGGRVVILDDRPQMMKWHIVVVARCDLME